ncbi:hypothetical protein H0B56_17650 [Haloechinothrix sp. YIM 98757]|uniref:Uncharacterized protein n=1 Tax=Haloechinothrix aidingensis TaxID=2752311 RepID=A0A838ADJ6_9PSEU|nr:hypothetical protein [Haloechinothrix aidingensis]MBA0127374.1 hypothetical protein [Haloechinothrix aidingensis]
MSAPSSADGTQEPPPQPMFPDPLAGLITGESTQAAVPGTDSSGFDAPTRRTFEGNPDGLDAMLRVVLDDEPHERAGSRTTQHGAREQPPGDRQPQGRRGFGPAQRMMSDASEQAKRVLTDADTKSSAGVAVAVVLIVLFVIIAVSLLASLVGLLSA